MSEACWRVCDTATFCRRESDREDVEGREREERKKLSLRERERERELKKMKATISYSIFVSFGIFYLPFHPSPSSSSSCFIFCNE